MHSRLRGVVGVLRQVVGHGVVHGSTWASRPPIGQMRLPSPSKSSSRPGSHPDQSMSARCVAFGGAQRTSFVDTPVLRLGVLRARAACRLPRRRRSRPADRLVAAAVGPSASTTCRLQALVRYESYASCPVDQRFTAASMAPVGALLEVRDRAHDAGRHRSPGTSSFGCSSAGAEPLDACEGPSSCGCPEGSCAWRGGLALSACFGRSRSSRPSGRYERQPPRGPTTTRRPQPPTALSCNGRSDASPERIFFTKKAAEAVAGRVLRRYDGWRNGTAASCSR